MSYGWRNKHLSLEERQRIVDRDRADRARYAHIDLNALLQEVRSDLRKTARNRRKRHSKSRRSR